MGSEQKLYVQESELKSRGPASPYIFFFHLLRKEKGTISDCSQTMLIITVIDRHQHRHKVACFTVGGGSETTTSRDNHG